MTESLPPSQPESLYTYGWQSAIPPHSQNYINPAILRILQSCGAPRVLDLGSGNGALCQLLHSSGFDVVGVEPDAAGVQISRSQNPWIPFYQLGVDADPVDLIRGEGLFDVVVSTEVIEHLYSPHLLPRFAWQCLKPGGLLVVTTPYHGYIKNLALSLAGKWDHHHTALWHGGHIKFWSRHTLARLLSAERFLVEDFVGVGRFPWCWKSMILLGKKRFPLTSCDIHSDFNQK